MCLPTAPALPPIDNGDFGVSPFCGQLSDKSQLALHLTMGVRDMKRNRNTAIKRRVRSCGSAHRFSKIGE
jgi:hypothetical protein